MPRWFESEQKVEVLRDLLEIGTLFSMCKNTTAATSAAH